MNRFQRWVKRAGGEPLDRLSQRAAGVAVRRSGLRRRLRPGGELPKDELRRHFVEDHGEDGAPEAWRQRARRFLFGPRRGPALCDALGWLVPDDVWRVAVEGPVTGLERGEALLFDRRQASVGWPPDFGRDPLTGARWPTLKHWSDYDTLDPQLPDNRPIQELSRFTLAFHIGRHVVRSRDEAAAQRLWIMFEAWDTQNPYGLTVHWASGREASYRLFAWLFATVATLDSEATTAARLARVTERAWYVAHHAEGDLGRARSRRDLDVLAQSAALWTVGALFPEMRRAGAWERRGRETFEAEVLRQVDTDGTFLQRGPFEHRTLLDLVLWSARLGELTGVPLGEATLERLGAAFRWLVELTDPDSGAVPNFGVNDGTHLLPLSTCAYGDMRPTLQAMSFLLYRRRAFAEGPWDEKMLWLFGPDALDADVGAWPRRGSSLASGGYETFVGPRTWAAVRSGKPSRVPDQADMLHLDLWDGPRNVLRDAGVLQAGPAGRWVTYGSSTAAHNVVEIDGEDQMRRAPRQRWARAVRSRFLRRRRSDDGRVDVFAGEHEGYRRLAGTPVHRRSLIRLDDAWVVVDDVLGTGTHDLTLRYRLFPTEWQRGDDDVATWHGRLDERTEWRLRAWLPAGSAVDVVTGLDGERPEGWEALHYGEPLAVPVWRASLTAKLPVRFVCAFDAPGMPLDIAELGEPGEAIRLTGLGGVTASVSALEDETFRLPEAPAETDDDAEPEPPPAGDPTAGPLD